MGASSRPRARQRMGGGGAPVPPMRCRRRHAGACHRHAAACMGALATRRLQMGQCMQHDHPAGLSLAATVDAALRLGRALRARARRLACRRRMRRVRAAASGSSGNSGNNDSLHLAAPDAGLCACAALAAAAAAQVRRGGMCMRSKKQTRQAPRGAWRRGMRFCCRSGRPMKQSRQRYIGQGRGGKCWQECWEPVGRRDRGWKLEGTKGRVQRAQSMYGCARAGKEAEQGVVQ